MSRRFDLAPLAPAEEMPNGMLRAEAYITRTGIFKYVQPDGSIRRELRTPEEVFDADSVASFRLLPVTNDHPGEMLTAQNAKMYHAGSLGDTIKRDGTLLRTSLMVHDPNLITKMRAGKVQVSAGYHCDIDETPGIYKGEAYDAVQTNIRGNHVAVVNIGRAGAGCAVRMDGGVMLADGDDDMAVGSGSGTIISPGAITDAGFTPADEVGHGTRKADYGTGVSPPGPRGAKADVVSEKVGAEPVKKDAGLGVGPRGCGPGPCGLTDSPEKPMVEEVTEDSEMKPATMTVSTAGGLSASKGAKKMDQMEVTIEGVAYKMDAEAAKAVTKLQARHDAADQVRLDAEDGEKFSRRVSARVNLERVAGKHLGDARMDAQTDREIKVAVLEKLKTPCDPKWTADYLDARFDAAVEFAEINAGKEALGNFRANAQSVEHTDAVDSKTARAKYESSLSNRWKDPVADGVSKRKGAQ